VATLPCAGRDHLRLGRRRSACHDQLQRLLDHRQLLGRENSHGAHRADTLGGRRVLREADEHRHHLGALLLARACGTRDRDAIPRSDCRKRPSATETPCLAPASPRAFARSRPPSRSSPGNPGESPGYLLRSAWRWIGAAISAPGIYPDRRRHLVFRICGEPDLLIGDVPGLDADHAAPGRVAEIGHGRSFLGPGVPHHA
jgi:hypothetical protein